jgi:chromosome segregation ATPase
MSDTSVQDPPTVDETEMKIEEPRREDAAPEPVFYQSRGLPFNWKVALSLALGLIAIGGVTFALVERSGKIASQKAVEDLHAQFDAQVKDLKDLKEDLQRTQNRASDADKALENQKTAAKQIQLQADDQKARADKLQTDLAASQEKARTAEANLVKEVEAKAAQLKALETQPMPRNPAAEAPAKAEADTKETKRLESDLARNKQVLSDQEAQLKKAQDLGKAQDAQLRQKDAEIQTLNNQVKSGEAGYTKLKNEYDKVLADKKKDDDEIKNLRAENAKLRNKK